MSTTPSKQFGAWSTCSPEGKEPFRVVNVGGGQPVGLLDFIAADRSRRGAQGCPARIADAARRRARDICQRGAAATADRIQATNAAERGSGKIRVLVPGILSK